MPQDTSPNSGVNISLREIYDTIQEVKNDVKGFGPMLEQVRKDSAKGVEAYDIAKQAFVLANKHEDGLKWVWRTVAGAFLTGIVGAIIGYMIISAQLSAQQQLIKTTVDPSSGSISVQDQGGSSNK